MRTGHEMYARYRYADGAREQEYYDLRQDPEQLRATLALPPGRAEFGRVLERLRRCGRAGHPTCRGAGQLP